MTYRASNRTLVGRLALHVEGNAIGGLGLNLQASCKQREKKPVSFIIAHNGNSTRTRGILFTRANVVEVLVEKLLKPVVSAFATPLCDELCLLFAVVVVDLVVLLVPRKNHARLGREKHTSLDALAMSEKAAGPDIL